MSPTSPTEELYLSEADATTIDDYEPVASTQELPVGADPGSHPIYYEAEPTTLSIPIAGGTTSVVLDEAESSGPRVPDAPPVPLRRARLGLLALAVGTFAAASNEASVVAMSTTIAAGLGVSVASIGLLATAFALTIVIATLPLTMATKRWSRRWTLSATFGVWTAGVVIVALANGLPMFAAGRVISATAHALFWALMAPAAASLFAPHLRARTVTTIMLGSAAAGVLGTPLVTALGAQVAWQAPYWGLAALGFVLTISYAVIIPRSRGSATRPHTVGDLPSRPAFFRVLAVAFIAAAAMSLSWTYVVPLFTEIAGLPVSAIPLLFALGGALAVGATLGISGHLSRRPVHTVGLAIGGLGIAWALLALGYSWSVVAFQALQAAAWAVLVAALLNWAMRHTPWRTEVGAGAYTVIFNSGAAVGPVIGAAIVATFGLEMLPWVSLGLTAVAGALVATVDSRTLLRLRVPRQVRVVLANQVALGARRSEWWWRKQLAAAKPRSYADLVGERTDQPRAEGPRASAKKNRSKAGGKSKPRPKSGSRSKPKAQPEPKAQPKPKAPGERRHRSKPK